MLRRQVPGYGSSLDARQPLQPVHNPLIHIQKSVIILLRKLMVEAGRLRDHVDGVEPEMLSAQVDETLGQQRRRGDQDKR